MRLLSQRAASRSGVAAAVSGLVQALLIAVAIRTFLFEPFNIPSGSMEPTLLVGDYLFVSKFSYGYSRYSMPFSLPSFSGRIFASRPHRGDVVVFRLPRDTTVNYIKRIIGLPGDRIRLTAGVLYINDAPVKREPIADFVGESPCGPDTADGQPVRVAQWHETLPNGVSYDTLQCTSFAGFPDTTRVYVVPPDHYFMMGDNREDSEDSRFSDVGYVPFDNIIGRAQLIFFSIAGSEPGWELWRWPWSVRWSRLPSSVE